MLVTINSLSKCIKTVIISEIIFNLHMETNLLVDNLVPEILNIEDLFSAISKKLEFPNE